MRGGSTELLSPNRAAARLGISRSTLDRNWQVWGLRKIRLTARSTRYKARDIDNLIEARSFEC